MSSLASIATALGDDELILGHRHSEWTGYAPHIEEDVAFSSIAQDEIGHASAYYSIAAKSSGKTVDEIAFGRSAADYRNALLCERPNNEWAFTLARHWLYDTAEDIRLASLEASSDPELAALSQKMRREERYHLIHADMWLKRIAHGPVEGRNKLLHALTEAFPDALGLFEPFEEEDAALAEGILPVASPELGAEFVKRTSATLDELGLPTDITAVKEQPAEFVASSSGDLIAADDTPESQPAGASDGFGGRRGKHTGSLAEIWDVMTKTYRDNPGATW
jgi:ring-1,2-phenylacetyl-CoA epoxidase subunit PaaC